MLRAWKSQAEKEALTRIGRTASAPPPGADPRLAEILELAATKALVLVRPIIPATCERDKFQVQMADHKSVLLKKMSSTQQVDVPTRRIGDILPATTTNPAVIVLEGRLQWLTLAERWTFFAERPPHDCHFGFSKPSSIRGAEVSETISRLTTAGYDPGWKLEERIPEALAEGAEIFYDEDGRYLIFPEGKPYILIVRRRTL
jgi:hypothetical protein